MNALHFSYRLIKEMLNEKLQGVTEAMGTEARDEVNRPPWILNVHKLVANIVCLLFIVQLREQ